jgi:exodeoxyribonuclease-1
VAAGQPPTNKNEIIAWDLRMTRELALLDVEQLRLRMFTRTADLPEGVTRLPIKTVHLNKSPMVVGNVNTLTPALAQRWHRPGPGGSARRVARAAGHERHLARGVCRPPEPAPDVEQDLYGGFVGNNDRRRLNERTLSGEQLARAHGFRRSTAGRVALALPRALVSRYLDAREAQRWEARAPGCWKGRAACGPWTVFAEIDQLSRPPTSAPRRFWVPCTIGPRPSSPNIE